VFPKLRALSNLLGGLYDAAADPTLWNPFLEQLALKTRSTSAALLVHDFEHARYSLSSSWQVRPESQRLYQEHYHALDIWAQRGLPLPAGWICSSQSLCPLSEMKSTEIYNDFMVAAGIEHGMFGMLENTKSRLASISLYRDRLRPEFTTSDLDILQLLSPHIQRAFKLHFHFSELKSRSESFEDALEILPTGVVFFDCRAGIVIMNRNAKTMAAEKDGLVMARNGLQAERQAESDLLTKVIREACTLSRSEETPAGGTVLVSRRARPPLQVLISPIRNSPISAPRSLAAVAFIADPLRPQRPTHEALRGLYGLTPAECRVALLLGDGHAPRQIANMIGVTENTVRSQIKSIFSKTGVKRQGELIRLLISNSSPAIRSQVIT